MDKLDILSEFYYGPAMNMLLRVVYSYFVAYVLAFVVMWTWKSLNQKIGIDQIVRFVLMTVLFFLSFLPVYYIYELVQKQPYHIIPFVLFCFVNIVIFADLYGKYRADSIARRSNRRSKHANT